MILPKRTGLNPFMARMNHAKCDNGNTDKTENYFTGEQIIR